MKQLTQAMCSILNRRFWKLPSKEQCLMIYAKVFSPCNTQISLWVGNAAMMTPQTQDNYGFVLCGDISDWSVWSQILVYTSLQCGHVLASKSPTLLLLGLFGNKVILPVALFMMSFFSIVMPWLIQSEYTFILQGVLLGTLQGLVSSCATTSQLNIKDFLDTIDIITSLLLASFITKILGWEYVFYIQGILGIVIAVVWWLSDTKSLNEIVQDQKCQQNCTKAHQKEQEMIVLPSFTRSSRLDMMCLYYNTCLNNPQNTYNWDFYIEEMHFQNKTPYELTYTKDEFQNPHIGSKLIQEKNIIDFQVNFCGFVLKEIFFIFDFNKECSMQDDAYLIILDLGNMERLFSDSDKSIYCDYLIYISINVEIDLQQSLEVSAKRQAENGSVLQCYKCQNLNNFCELKFFSSKTKSVQLNENFFWTINDIDYWNMRNEMLWAHTLQHCE